MLSFAEKVRVILQRRKMTQADLARLIGISPHNMVNKMRRNNFSERDMLKITEALNCDFDLKITMRDTNDIL